MKVITITHNRGERMGTLLVANDDVAATLLQLREFIAAHRPHTTIEFEIKTVGVNTLEDTLDFMRDMIAHNPKGV